MAEGIITAVVILICISVFAVVLIYGAPWLAYLSGRKLTEDELGISGRYVEEMTDELNSWMKLFCFLEAANLESRETRRVKVLFIGHEGWNLRNRLADLDRGGRAFRKITKEAKTWIEESQIRRAEVFSNPLLAALGTEEISSPTQDELREWIEDSTFPIRWQKDFQIERHGDGWRPIET